MDNDELYRHVVRSFTDGIVVLDLDGTIRFANPSADAMMGTELAGRHVSDFLDMPGAEQSLEHLERAGRGELLEQEVDTLLVRADGTPLWVRLKQTGLLHDGQVNGLILRLTDNHDSKRLNDERDADRRRLLEAERIARLGSWAWDRTTGTATYSESLEEVFGDNTTALLSGDLEQTLAITHPEDRERLAVATRALVDGETPRIDMELRQQGRHGWIWVRLRAEARRGPDGSVVAIAGTHQDITRARATEDQLQDLVTQNSLMQAIASAANEAAALDDVLVHAQSLVVLHDDWDRARAFVPDAAGTRVVPRYYVEAEEALDADRGGIADLELRTAQECFRQGESVWDDEDRLTIAFPLRLDGEILAVLTITSRPPLHRHDMIQSMVEQAALQLGRVAEREKAARELADARDRALAASQHKSEFLAMMSHEIRTPLNGIIGLNELLGRTDLDAKQQHYVAGIAMSSRALLEVINDILDFSRIETGRLDLAARDFAVREVLEQVSGFVAESARAKGLDLQVSCSPVVPEQLLGDPARLRQVIANLAANAVKFTEAGSVRIRAAVDDDPHHDAPPGAVVLRVEVSDTGIGVAPDRQSQIFSPFVQADSSTTRIFGGTGLGLAISAEIVAAMGGRIGVDSALESGSTFWFTVPLRAAEADTEDDAAAELREMLGHTRALVIDNEAVDRLFLREQLSWWHVTSTGVATIDEALDAAAAAEEGGQPFDIVLLVTGEPQRDALVLAAAAHGDRRFAAPPIVVLSVAAPDDLGALHAAGVAEVLTRPVPPATLREALVRNLGGDRPTPALQPAATPSPRRDGALVLVAEDNPVNRIVARGLLESLGYAVDVAENGQEALELTEEVEYAAVLMDLQMPELDGYGATRAIREREASRPGARRLPVIAMTAAAISGERERCLAAGMDDFISKPVAPPTLAATLAAWIPAAGADPHIEPPHGQPHGEVPQAGAGDAAPVGPLSSHLDEERLEMLRELSPEDNAYLDRVIDGFIRRAPETLGRIDAAVEAHDAGELAAAAHSLKGSAQNIGVPSVGDIAAELEGLGRVSSTVGAGDLVVRLRATLDDAAEALLAYQRWYRALPPEATP